MSYYMTGGRRALRGVGQDLNLDPYAGMPCKSVPLTAPVTGTTGSGQLCYYGTCGDINALRQALQDLGFGPVTSSTNLLAAGGPLAKAAAKYGVSYAPGASPSADLCVAILNAWHPPITGVRSTVMSRTMMPSSTTGVKAPPSTKATCVGECLYWDGVEQKCFTITTGKCAPAQQQPVSYIPRGGTPTTGVTPVPLLQLPPDVMCNAKGGTWDAATGLCSAGALQPTPEQTELACNVAGGFYDAATGQCLVGGEQPAEQSWWSGLSDGTKYAIIGGAVVAVGAIGAGVYFATRKPKAKANTRRSALAHIKKMRKTKWRGRYLLEALLQKNWYQFEQHASLATARKMASVASAYASRPTRVIDGETGRVVASYGKKR